MKGWGQKIRYVPRNQGIKLFWRGIPIFCWDMPAVPEKFEKTNAFNFWPPNPASPRVSLGQTGVISGVSSRVTGLHVTPHALYRGAIATFHVANGRRA